ncbi:hypothetical protein MMC29_007714 [Sticta canariensis]|nr:hypothetical protein [Sticta canariensis]
MSSRDRPSPRASIRDWLSRTVPEADGQQNNLQTSKHLGRACQPSGPQPRQSIEDGLSGGDIELSRDINCRDPIRTQQGAEFRQVKMARPSDESLPRVLGLYAPFRSFGWEKADIDINNDLARAGRKRKRRHSSVSSYLEPATFTVRTHAGESFGDRKKAPVSLKLHAELDDSASQPSLGSPRTSAITSIRREKPNRDYERRSRHRTRKDRYEPKEVKEAKKRKKKKNEDPPKEKKRKRKEKSGAALMHDFTAQNVAHDRLTLRSEPSVGLFGKGRSSLPVKRRGLPDLAFSELTFLNPHRKNSDDLRKSSVNKSRHKTDKDADPGANISRYFTSTKSMNHNEVGPDSRPAVGVKNLRAERERKSCDDRNSKSMDRETSLPLVELLGRPFLGFGGPGTDVTSPARISRNVGSTFDPPRGKASSTRSTSHISWSASGAPSYHSSQLHPPDNTSIRSPIHIERTRASITDVPIDHSEVSCLDRAPKQVSAKNDTYRECPRSVLKSRNPVPENGLANRSIPFAPQSKSGSLKKHASPKNASSDSHGSPKESRPQQSLPNDKFKAACTNEAQVEVPCLPLPVSPGGLSQNSSISFDAELDNFLEKFKPKQTQSVHELARQVPTRFVQSEVPSVVDHEDYTKLEKGTDILSASENKYINAGVGGSPSRHGSAKPSEIPSTQALEVQINQTDKPLELKSLMPARRRNSRNLRNRCRSGNTEGWLEHDGFSRTAWSGHNNIYQQETEIGNHDSRSNQHCEKVHMPDDFEGPENVVVFHDLSSDVHNELDGHEGYENVESYHLNRDMVGSGYQGDGQHDESTILAPPNMEELFYQSNLTGGSELDIPPYRNGLLHHSNVPSEDFLELGADHPYPPNHDLDASALAGNKDRYKHDPEEKCESEDHRRLDLRSRLWSQNGPHGLKDYEWMASVQQNDDELSGFWKPHKRY